MLDSDFLAPSLAKAPTGIHGFDEMTEGGLPRGRTTLIFGGPGSGKTVFALQSLVNGARLHDEPGIFVAFEEKSARILENAASFGWKMPFLLDKGISFVDAQMSPDELRAGAFDLSGLLMALDALVERSGAQRVVFDALDVVISQLDDPSAERREIHRLHTWLLERGLTAIITAKSTLNAELQDRLEFMQYMLDSTVVLSHNVVAGVSQRNVRVAKYRGTAFSENESPMVIGRRGMEVAGVASRAGSEQVTRERVSSGLQGLDDMLGGGYYRKAGILISGSPGTAKTTLAGAFAQAACQRGERVLFVSFDSDAGEVIRNLASVSIDLTSHLQAGALVFHTSRTTARSAEAHLLHIKSIAEELEPHCLVVDPISSLGKPGNEETGHGVVERLIDWAKERSITVLCTSLLAGTDPEIEGTILGVSTIADTWIHLSYSISAGERNRGLTIVKSRGTGHSNQVRELILRDDGLSLAEVYTAGGKVLMGTMRWECERADQEEERTRRAELRRRVREIESARDELSLQSRKLQDQIEWYQSEFERLSEDENSRLAALARTRETVHRMRGGGGAFHPTGGQEGRKVGEDE